MHLLTWLNRELYRLIMIHSAHQVNYCPTLQVQAFLPTPHPPPPNKYVFGGLGRGACLIIFYRFAVTAPNGIDLFRLAQCCHISNHVTIPLSIASNAGEDTLTWKYFRQRILFPRYLKWENIDPS
jgi:hypothetical protein